jgi:hypothetical protein
MRPGTSRTTSPEELGGSTRTPYGTIDLPKILLGEKRDPSTPFAGPGRESRDVALVRRDHDLAARLRRDPVLVAIVVHASAFWTPRRALSEPGA